MDRTRFAELYHAHFPFVWRVLRRHGVSETETADAVQDVFVIVYQKLPEFEGRSKLTTWIYSICFRVACEHRRRAAKRGEVPIRGLGSVSDSRPGPEAILDDRQLQKTLERTLDQIPMDQRQVLTLFEYEGMTGQEIAELLDLPLGTVYTRLRQARIAFRRILKRVQASPAQARVMGGAP